MVVQIFKAGRIQEGYVFDFQNKKKTRNWNETHVSYSTQMPVQRMPFRYYPETSLRNPPRHSANEPSATFVKSAETTPRPPDRFDFPLDLKRQDLNDQDQHGRHGHAKNCEVPPTIGVKQISITQARPFIGLDLIKDIDEPGFICPTRSCRVAQHNL